MTMYYSKAESQHLLSKAAEGKSHLEKQEDGLLKPVGLKVVDLKEWSAAHYRGFREKGASE